MMRKTYHSDLSDSERSIIEPLFLTAKKQGRGRKREIVNAILYLLQEECQWRSHYLKIIPQITNAKNT